MARATSRLWLPQSVAGISRVASLTVAIAAKFTLSLLCPNALSEHHSISYPIVLRPDFTRFEASVFVDRSQRRHLF